MQVFANDTKGLNLALVESLAGQQLPLSKGPFSVAVQDSNAAGSVAVTAGSDDQTTPTNFKPNGTGALGTITAIVTDLGQTPPLVAAPISFDIVAPVVPPPQVPDTLTASFVPAV